MKLLSRLRYSLFPPEPAHDDHEERKTAQSDRQAAIARQQAIALMQQWDPERAEDLRRINRTGNVVEGWLVPDPERRNRT